MVSFPSAITSLDDYEEALNILVYGDSGVGKTVFAGTAPNALILSTERGLVSAKRFGSKAKVWKIRQWEGHPDGLDLVSAYNWLYDNPDHGFDWIVLDSITEMQNLALRGILSNAVEESHGVRDPDIPAIQDHQKWQNMMKRFIQDFNELPVKTLWTAIKMDVEDEDGEALVLPYLVGKGYQISQFACAQMQMVGYLTIRTRQRDSKDGRYKAGEQFRRLYLQKKDNFFAKDRYSIGEYIDNPTVAEIDRRVEHSLANPVELPTNQPRAPRATTLPKPPGLPKPPSPPIKTAEEVAKDEGDEASLASEEIPAGVGG